MSLEDDVASCCGAFGDRQFMRKVLEGLLEVIQAEGGTGMALEDFLNNCCGAPDDHTFKIQVIEGLKEAITAAGGDPNVIPTCCGAPSDDTFKRWVLDGLVELIDALGGGGGIGLQSAGLETGVTNLTGATTFTIPFVETYASAPTVIAVAQKNDETAPRFFNLNVSVTTTGFTVDPRNIVPSPSDAVDPDDAISWVAIDNSLTASFVQSGTNANAGSGIWNPVVFGTAYASKPTVVVTPSYPTGSTNFVVNTRNVTTTGFEFLLDNVTAGSGHGNTTDGTFWMAVGTL